MSPINNRLLKSELVKFWLAKYKIAALTCIVLMVVAWLAIAVWQTNRVVKLVRNFQISPAARVARFSKPPVSFLQLVTIKKIAAINAWQSLLDCTIIADDTFAEGKKITAAIKSQQAINLSPFLQQLQLLEGCAAALDTAIAKSKLLQLVPNHDELTRRGAAAHLHLQNLVYTINYLVESPRKIAILLQNTHELRATGGFMGSYVLINFANNQPLSINVYDIYQPDGQFTGYIPAPPGMAEYLSANHGLRLPDSNWQPDFPTAANEILRLFSLGNEKDIDILIALNLTWVENAMQLLGPIYLPDYQTTVTADNLADLARANRNDFFAGSQEKRLFLQSLLKQLQYQTSFNSTKLTDLSKLFQLGIQQKDWQFFSTDSHMQDIFSQYQATGQLSSNVQSMMLVESNVGINKVNPHISRQVEVDIQPTQTIIYITWQNNSNELDYANYQRLLLPTSHVVTNTTINEQPINTDFSTRIIKTTNKLEWLEVGWLVGVEKQAKTTTEISITHPPIDTSLPFTIYKQAGLPATPYQIRWQHQIENILLGKNAEIWLVRQPSN